MKNYVKRAVAIIIFVIMVFTSVPLNGFIFSYAEEIEVNEQVIHNTGDVIEFGSYPQSEVTDESVKNALNGLINESDWVSYGYYSGNGTVGSMTQGNFMKYADVEYNGEEYRAVKFSAYRPAITYGTGYSDSPSQQTGIEYNTSYQHDNGYEIDTVYFFKYEPLEWRVLDPYDGTIMCESIIDSQAFSNKIYQNNNEYYTSEDYEFYANNYAKSTIRSWLNETFYNTAFSNEEKKQFLLTSRDGYSYGSDDYKPHSTEKDKLFLLHHGQIRSTAYKFSSDFGFYDPNRKAKGSDYAKCQGLWVNNAVNSDSAYKGNSFQITCTASSTSKDIVYIGSGGVVGSSITNYSNVCNVSAGIRPACRITGLKYADPIASIQKDKRYKDNDFIHYGSPLFHDSVFNYSMNGMEIYSNYDHNAISIEKVSKDNECPTNASYMIRITTSGEAKPGFGGFVQSIEKKEGGKFYHVIIAKVPVGYELDATSNTLGVYGHINYLTDMKGTGKWELYIFEINYGLLFQDAAYGYDSGHVYLKKQGSARYYPNQFEAPITWYVGYANVFDNTGDKCFSTGEIISGNNEIYRYNNNYLNSENVTVSNVSASSDCPTTSGNMIQIKTTAGSSRPGLGGFFKQVSPEADRVYYHKMVAKVPEGFQLSYHMNALSANCKWITSNQGTGKWETYIYKVKVDKTPANLGTFGFVALYPNNSEGIYNSETGNYDFQGSVTWYLAYNNIFKNYEFEENLTKDDMLTSSTLLYDGQEYALYNYPVSYHMAELLCEKIGGHLATIADDDENAALFGMISSASTSTTHYWINGSDEQSEGTWKYSSGENLSYTNWDSSQPDNYEGLEHYIELGTTRSGKWNDVSNNYSSITGFVCEFETALVPQNSVCWNGHIYSLYNKTLSWNEAETWCENMGGHLVTITTLEENDVVSSLMTGSKLSQYFIGASDAAVEGTWKWVTDESWNYNFWNTGEPNDSGTGEDYAMIYKDRNNSWNDTVGDKNSIRGFICEVEYYKLCPSNSGAFNGHTYEVYETLTSWLDAEKIAEQKGGHLVTITTVEENDYVKSLLTSEYKYPYAIGLRTTAVNQAFSWVTGEKSLFSDWSVGNPDCKFGCAELFVSLYYYNNTGYNWADMRSIRGGVGQYFIIEYESEIADTVFDYNNGLPANLMLEPSVHSGWQLNSDGKFSIAYDTVTVKYDPTEETFCFDTNGRGITNATKMFGFPILTELKDGQHLTMSSYYISGRVESDAYRCIVFEGTNADLNHMSGAENRVAIDIPGDQNYDNSAETHNYTSGPINSTKANYINKIGVWFYSPQNNLILKDYTIRLKASVTNERVENLTYTRLAQTVENDKPIVDKSFAPEKTGYQFNGWETVESSALKTGAVLKSAVFNPNEYTLTFNANGGTCDVENKIVYYDSEIGELPVPTRSGYTFIGWYAKKKGGSLVSETDVVKTTSDRTIYACWSIGESNVCGDNAIWQLKGNTLFISGTGDMYDYTAGNAPWNNLNSYISEIKVDKGITGIGNNAFNGLAGAESITLADSILRIGDCAFKNCIVAEGITIPGSVSTIGESAFENMSITEIVIPYSVQSIGDSAFDGCHQLNSITVINPHCILPDYWLTNNDNATVYGYSGSTAEIFANESDVIFVEIGKFGVFEPFEWQFTNSTKVLDIYGTGDLPDYNGRIAPWTPFSGDIEKVVFHDGITYIGNFTLSRCSSVNSIKAPKTLRNIGKQAFEDTLWFANQEDGIVTFGTVLYSYKGNSESKNIVLGNGITAISGNFSESFKSGSVSPESLQISASVTEIDNGALSYAGNLKTLSVNAGNAKYKTLNNILYSKDGKTLFCYPAGLDGKFNIPSSVSEIAEYAFSGCDALTEINIGKNILSISDEAFVSSDLSTIHGFSGSYAETYAQKNGYEFLPYTSTVTLNWNDKQNNLDEDTKEILTINTGTAVGELNVPSKEGYNFIGWYLETDDEDVLINPDYIVNEDVIFYAFWDKELEEEAHITGISVANVPIKTEYYVGDSLNPSGMELTIHYSDGSDRTVTDGYYCVPSVLNISGTQSIKVMHSGFESAFDVTVLSVIPVSISIINLPKTTSYFAGDHLNTRGLTVKVVYNNGTQKIIKNTSLLEYEYDLSTPSSATDVTVKYEENDKTVSTKYQVEVKQCPQIYSVSVVANSGEAIGVPVYISGNQGIMGYVIRIEYDADVFTPIGMPQNQLGGSIGSVIKEPAGDNDQQNNKVLEIIWYNTAEYSSDGLLFTQLFKVDSKAESGTYDIYLSFSQEETFNENFDNVLLQCSDAQIEVENIPTPLIYSEKLEGSVGDELEIPIYFANNVGIDEMSMLTIAFDSSSFYFISCQNSVGTVIKTTEKNGTVKILLNKVTDSTLNGTLIIIRLKVSNDAQPGIKTITMNIDDSKWTCDAVDVKVIKTVLESVVGGSAVSVKGGESFTTAVSISDNPGLMGYRFNLHYDTSILKLIGISCNENWNNGQFEYNDDQGDISIVWINTENVNANGTMFDLTFIAKNIADQESEISIDYVTKSTYNEKWEDVHLVCRNINVNITHENLITAISGTGTKINHSSKYIYGIAPGKTDLNDRILVKDGYTISLINMYDKVGTGSYVIVMSNEIEVDRYTIILFGDVDGDGWYNGMDAFIVSLISAGLLTEEDLGTAAWMAADANHDGSIDEADFRLLEQAGLFIAEVDQLASHEDLIQTNSAYVEYLALIDQSFEAEEFNENPSDESLPEEPDTVTEADQPTDEQSTTDKSAIVVIPWYAKLFNAIMKYVNLILSIFF